MFRRSIHIWLHTNLKEFVHKEFYFLYVFLTVPILNFLWEKQVNDSEYRFECEIIFARHACFGFNNLKKDLMQVLYIYYAFFKGFRCKILDSLNVL